MRRYRPVLALTLALLLSACVRNNAREIALSDAAAPDHGLATVAFGLEIEPTLNDAPYSIELDRYDPSTMQLDAGCWVYDRILLSAGARFEGVRYFAFRAPAGHYGPSPLTSLLRHGLSGGTSRKYPYFEAAAGNLLYLGDFVFRPETVPSRLTFQHRRTDVSITRLWIESDERRIDRFRKTLGLRPDGFRTAQWQSAATLPQPILCVP